MAAPRGGHADGGSERRRRPSAAPARSGTPAAARLRRRPARGSPAGSGPASRDRERPAARRATRRVARRRSRRAAPQRRSRGLGAHEAGRSGVIRRRSLAWTLGVVRRGSTPSRRPGEYAGPRRIRRPARRRRSASRQASLSDISVGRVAGDRRRHRRHEQTGVRDGSGRGLRRCRARRRPAGHGRWNVANRPGTGRRWCRAVGGEHVDP